MQTLLTKKSKQTSSIEDVLIELCKTIEKHKLPPADAFRVVQETHDNCFRKKFTDAPMDFQYFCANCKNFQMDKMLDSYIKILDIEVTVS